MVDFLNQFMLENMNHERVSAPNIRDVFVGTIEFLSNCIGSHVFAHKKSFNRVLFESVILLAAKELEHGLECERFKKFYESLVNDEQFWSLARHSTTSRANMFARRDHVKDLYENTHP
jgi:hypothetical protein